MLNNLSIRQKFLVAFGGSDIVVMFEKDKVKITAQVGTHYNQGKTIATTVE